MLDIAGRVPRFRVRLVTNLYGTFGMELRGIEPLTSAMRMQRSPS